MGRRRKEATRKLKPARVAVYLEEETRDALNFLALKEKTSATELVERLIKGYLAKHARNSPRKG
jgi:hypothetical protein